MDPNEFQSALDYLTALLKSESVRELTRDQFYKLVRDIERAFGHDDQWHAMRRAVRP